MRLKDNEQPWMPCVVLPRIKCRFQLIVRPTTRFGTHTRKKGYTHTLYKCIECVYYTTPPNSSLKSHFGTNRSLKVGASAVRIQLLSHGRRTRLRLRCWQMSGPLVSQVGRTNASGAAAPRRDSIRSAKNLGQFNMPRHAYAI